MRSSFFGKWTLALAVCAVHLGASAEIVIGRMGSLVNPVAGPTTKLTGESFERYIDVVNKEGGINGQAIRVVFRDDEFKPDMVVSSARALIEEDGVLALVMPQGTPGTMALIQTKLLEQTSTPVVGPFTGAKSVLEHPTTFPLRASYNQEIEAMIAQMKSVGHKRIAYFYYKVAFGANFEPIFKSIVEESGLEYAGPVGFEVVPDPEKQVELINAAAKELGALNADSAFLFAVGPSVKPALLAMNNVAGKALVRYTFSINNWESVVKNLGPDDARGVVFSQAVPYPYGAGRQVVREYQAFLKKHAPDLEASFSGLEGYMTGKLLVTALRKAGDKPSRKSLYDALERLGRFDLGGYVVEYTRGKHRIVPSVDMTIIGSEGRLLK